MHGPCMHYMHMLLCRVTSAGIISSSGSSRSQRFAERQELHPSPRSLTAWQGANNPSRLCVQAACMHISAQGRGPLPQRPPWADGAHLVSQLPPHVHCLTALQHAFSTVYRAVRPTSGLPRHKCSRHLTLACSPPVPPFALRFRSQAEFEMQKAVLKAEYEVKLTALKEVRSVSYSGTGLWCED